MVAAGEKVFGKYEVLRRLAVGGMGEIFLSRQIGVVDRIVILKSLLPQMAGDDRALASFLDEARILASINHPNVVALYDVGEWGDTHFIAMEFINGVDISHLLKFCEDHKKRMPPLVTAHVVREAALGLDAAHVATDAGGTPLRVVHRDISPHNLMIRADGLCKVVDFGVAVADNRQQKTEAGMLKGKLGYMAPEQIKGSPVEPKADQFSLGVLMWEMLTQRRLYTGDNAAQVFMRILKEKVAAPSTLVADVPPELDAIVLRMTAQEPVDRFARLGDCAMAIRRVLEQYKSPDNAAAQMVRATVGPELLARLKELAQRSSGGGGPAIAPLGGGTPTATTAPKAICNACGTASPAGDRFCRSCGSALGSSNSGTPVATPAPNLNAPGSRGTGSIPRVDVMGPSATSTGAVRRPDVIDQRAGAGPPASMPGAMPQGTPQAGTRAPVLASFDSIFSPPASMPGVGAAPAAAAPAVTQPQAPPPPSAAAAPVGPTELAVLAGFVEMVQGGHLVPADADARKAAFAVVDDIAARHRTLAQKNDNGRFAIPLVGANATADAVALARSNVRMAARAGRGVLFRLAVASESRATPESLPRLRGVADQLIDNAAPGSAVIDDGSRVRAGSPPTSRSATVRLREGSSVVAHELQLPPRLIGRGAELLAIDGVLDSVEREKKAGQIMLLGEGGVGKTALLDVAQAFARDRGFVCGLARGARVKEPVALDVLRQLVKSVSLDLVARERVTGPWTRAVDLCGLPRVSAARLTALIDDENDAGLQAIPAPRRRAVLKSCVLAFFEKLCARTPVLLVVDDQHKGDAASFEILAELGARLADQRLCVIVAGRPVQGERIMPLAKRVMIGPVSAPDVVAIASQMLGCPVADPLASMLVQRSLGNPLVVAILLRHLLHLRAIAPSPYGVQALVDLERLALPPSPTALIHARHAALPLEAQSLLLAAAHIGQVVQPAQLTRVVDGVRDIIGVLRGLTDAGILELLPDSTPHGPGDDDEQWGFTSTVELETIPARLDAHQARVLQQRVADSLAKDLEVRFTLETGERLAAHLYAAEARQKGAEISTRVAERAAALGLFDVAAEHHKRALAVEWRGVSGVGGAAKVTEEKADRVLRAAAVACQCMLEVDPHAAVDIVAPVLKSLPVTLAVQARVEALRQRGLALSRMRAWSDAENCFDEAIETLTANPSAATSAALFVDQATVLEQRGDVDTATLHLQQAMRNFAQAPAVGRERAWEAQLLLGRLALRQRGFGQAREAFGQALDETRRAGRHAGEAEARALLGALSHAEGNVDGALRETEQGILLAEGIGDPILEARLRTQLGRVFAALGRRADAANALALAVSCARRGQWDEGVSAAQQLLTVVRA